MKIAIRHRCADAASYRAALVKSLYNVGAGTGFDLDADLPVEAFDWKLGLIVGPSGSGKSSLGRELFGPGCFYEPNGWPENKPIVDAVGPAGDFDAAVAALAAVGLGTVPAWLRPYRLLSTGEKFRADLARVLAAAPDRVVIDEFTSVVDRRIAQIGSLAFARAWRRTAGRCVLLSCHRDIVPWLKPDWVYDTAAGTFTRGSLRRRPPLDVEVRQVRGRDHWPAFEPHHYLKLPYPPCAAHFVGFADGEPVCHVAASPFLGAAAVRLTRLVVLPEWQGAGIGLRFLEAVAGWNAAGHSRYGKRVARAFFHTSHPGLVAALPNRPGWRVTSRTLCDGDKDRSNETINRTRTSGVRIQNGGYGGHLRGVTGFAFEPE